jgi:hypothetical protein
MTDARAVIPIRAGFECCETSIFEDSSMVINKFTEVHFLSPFPQMYGKISIAEGRRVANEDRFDEVCNYRRRLRHRGTLWDRGAGRASQRFRCIEGRSY